MKPTKIIGLLLCLALPTVAFAAPPEVQAAGVPADMVLVPVGEFDMGDALGEGFADELPVHRVLVSAFGMGKYEVTNEQVRAAFQWALDDGQISATASTVVNVAGNQQGLLSLESNDCQLSFANGTFSVDSGKGSYPCVEITWFGAAAYANFRSEMEGKATCYSFGDWSCDFTKIGYRLPTAAEWEKAARGGLSGKRFPWGDTISHTQANYDSNIAFVYDVSPTRGPHPDYDDGVVPYTSPVGAFAANAYGLYDMAGNVSEWCGDWFSSDWYSQAGAVAANPTGPASGTNRVYRDGSWLFYAVDCRTAYRGDDSPGVSYYDVGCRLALPAGPIITAHPQSLTKDGGQAAAFSVTATGLTTPLTYQWRKDGADISGATSSSYAIASVQESDEGAYDCVVTNSLGYATSNAATLAVGVLPSITAQPQSLSKKPGESATFSVTATSGAAVLSYQWRKDGSNISGATSASYTIAAVQESDKGSYDCVVSNANGAVASDPATLYVGVPGGMALIPAGEFDMGDSLADGYPDELPVHRVFVSAFGMDKYEVTNEQVRAAFQWALGDGQITATATDVVNVAGDQQGLLSLGSSECQLSFANGTFSVDSGKGSYPCVEITWYGAAAYANFRSAMEGKPTCYNFADWSCDLTTVGYRLPTAAEWEKAARGGLSGKRFPWGDTISHTQANYDSNIAYAYDVSPTRGFHPDYSGGGSPYTSPVGSFAANAYGLYDMAGNVSEWCGDWFSSDWYSQAGAVAANPIGPAAGADRVYRDGSWYYYAEDSRTAFRGNESPASSFDDNGCRPVLPVGPFITAQPQSLAKDAGEAAAFSVAATGLTAPFTYQWRKGAADIPGATSSSYAIAAVQESDEGDYDCVVTHGLGYAMSDAATLTVGVPPSITAQPQSLTKNPGEAATFSVTAVGGASPLSYQWRNDGQSIPGATSASYTIASVQEIDEGGYDCVVSNANGVVASDAGTLTVNDLPAITAHPQSLGRAPGESATFSVVATSAFPLSYQWRKGGGSIAGATNSSYTIASVQESDEGSYDCVVASSAGAVASNAATLTVDDPPVITAQPQSLVKDPGESATFAVAATGTGTLAYQWRKGGSSIAGAVSASYTIVSVQESDEGSYDCVVSQTGVAVASNAATLTVNEPPTITAHPQSLGGAPDEPATFTVAATGTAPLSYQWRKGGANIAGAASASYTIAAAQESDEGSYDCVVTNRLGSATSNAATLVVNGVYYVKSDAGGTNDGSSWANAFTSLQAALGAVGSGNELWVAAGTYKPGAQRSDSFTLQSGVALYGGFSGAETHRRTRDWTANPTILSGDLNDDDNGNIAADEASRQDNSYQIVIAGGTDAAAVLDGFTVTGANDATTKGGGFYALSGSPTVANCILTKNAAGSGGGMYHDGGSPTMTNCAFTNNTAEFGGGMYSYGGSPTIRDCAFANNTAASYGGGIYLRDTSGSITNCSFANNTTLYGGGMYNRTGAPTITNCTFANNTASNGGGAIRNFIAGAPVLTNCIMWGNTPDEIGNYQTTPAASYCDISGSGGSASWDTSIGADNGGNIDADPLLADAANGDLALTTGSPCIDAGNGDAASSLDIRGRRRYDDPAATNTGAGTPAYTDMGAYEFEDPYITQHPQSLTKDPGAAASFTVVATGTATLTYQWRKGGANIAGATSASYTIASAQESDEGSYDCVVTNSIGVATSSAATLTVNDPPSITTQPQSLTQDPGDSATFSVTAAGKATLTYQWRKGGANVSGATGASYTIASVQESDQGSYDCVVTNGIGNAASNAATLTVNDPPVITAHPQSLTPDPGDAATFNVTATGTAPLSYQWRKGGVDIGAATSASYTIASVQKSDEGSFDCVVSNSAGAATSDAAALSVNDPPSITAQPQSLTRDRGSAATFTVTAAGTAPLSYQWRKDGTNIGGATSASYTVASVQESEEGSYDCVVTNSAGSAASNAATLFMNLPPPAPDGPSPADNATGVALDATLDWADTLRASTYSVYLGVDPPARPSFARQEAGVDIDDGLDGWTAPGELHAADLDGDGDLDVLSASLDDAGVAWHENDGQAEAGFTEHPISADADGLLAVNTADIDGDGKLDVLAMSAFDDKIVWYKNSVAGTVTTDLTSSNFQPASPLAAGQLYYWRVRAENVNGTIWGATWQFTAAIAPAITAQPQALARDPGAAATFTLAATGTAPLSYQWRKGGANISGAVGASYTIAAVQESDEGNFDCVVTNIAGAATSNAVALTVNGPPVVTAQPQSLTKDPGDAATFSVTSSGTAPLSYQWRKGGANISGAASASYTIAAVQESDEGNFDCVVTNSAGAATSNAATLTVNDPPVVTAQPQSLTKDPAAAATFTVVATGTAQLSYQWRKGGANIANATNASYTIVAVQESDEGSYDCVVANSAGAATSNAATLTVNDPPVVTAQPQSLTKDPAAAATFTVVATGTAPLSYQWRKGGVDIGGATNASYTIAAAQESDEGSFDCVVTNSAGTAASNAATLAVHDPPSITAHPQALVRDPGDAATFTVTAAGKATLTYQWRKGGANIVGATNASYTIAAVQESDEGSFDCVVTNGLGNITSNAATLTVNDPPSIVAQPQAVTEDPGHPVTFTVTAAGKATLTYQWRKGGVDIAGATSASYTIAAVQESDEGSFDCVVTNDLGVATSNAAALSVNDPPSIVAQPQSLTKDPGDTATFTLTAAGKAPLSYQWRKGGANISGATSASFTIAAVQESDEGSFDCVVTNSAGSATTNAATLTVNDPPSITAHPQSLTKDPGDGATFTVAAAGSAPLLYQWRKGGSNIIGATSASYTIASAQETDEGSYDCVVANHLTSATSNAATLAVNDPPVITAQPQSLQKDPGAAATFTVTVTGTAPLSYQWRKGGANISGATSASYTIASVQESDEASYDCVVTNSAGTATCNAAALFLNLPPLAPDSPSPADNATGVALDATLDWADTLRATTYSVYLGVDPPARPSFARQEAGVEIDDGLDGWTAPGELHAADMDGDGDLDVLSASSKDASLAWYENDGREAPDFTEHAISADADGLLAVATADIDGDGELDVLAMSVLDDKIVWYKNTIAGTVTTGLTSSSYQPAAPLTAGQLYYWRVRAENVTGTTWGATWQFTAAIAPAVTAPPQSLAKDPGAAATFSVTATGTAPLSYQWRKGGSDISGANSAGYTIAAVQESDEGDFDCVVTNIAGTATSNAATLSVNDPPVITAQPQSLIKDPGDAATFSVTVTGTAPLGYQWRKGGSDIAGATSASYTIASVQESDEGSFDCVVANSADTATSNAATLTVNDPPVLTAHPQSLTRDPGATATFLVAVTGTTPLSYQWRKGGNDIAGAASPSYTIAAVQESDEGSYDCVVTNSAGTAASLAVTLTVNDPPVITAHPQSLTKDPGELASFLVAVTGTAPLSYQWRKDGSDIAGATLRGYVIVTVQEGDQGSYDCIVTNSAGTAASNAAMLLVNDPPPAPTGVAARTVAAHGKLVLKWTAAPGATGYRIYYDDETDDPLGPPAVDGKPASNSDVGNVTKITIRGLQPGKRHYLAVVAYSSAGTSPQATVTARAGNVAKAWVTGPAKVRKGRRYNYTLWLKWNNGATIKARSGVKWRLNRAGSRRAAIGKTSGKLYVKRKTSPGWFRIFASYSGKTYRKSVKVVAGSAGRPSLAATPVLLYRLNSRLTTLDGDRHSQRRGGRLFLDTTGQQFTAVVAWRDGVGGRFYQRQDWHHQELADYTVDGLEDSTVKVVATLSSTTTALTLRRMQGRIGELTLAGATLDAARRYRGAETTLDADGAAYATGPLLARLDAAASANLAEAGTGLETGVADFVAELEARGFVAVPPVARKRDVAAPAADEVLVYRQRRRLAVVGDGEKEISHRGGFLVIDLANNLATALSTRTDAEDNRSYARQDWHADADLLLDYHVTGRKRVLQVLGALTDFDLIDLKGALTRGGGPARLLRGRLQVGSAAGYPSCFGSGILNARLDARRTQAATGDHAEAVAALIAWLEERGYAAE